MVLDIPAVTVDVAASELGLTTGRVRQLLRADVLAGEKVSPQCWLVLRESIEQYKTAHRKPGPKPVKNS